ncbi:MAG: cation diffusion facilitator family transporter [Acutalibacteraceae bacterium]|nr:cation diffusion facilitator family transporter [Acutalibacteraceae bacterium]
MTGLLIKLFVKNSDKVADNTVRENYGTLAGVVGILCNLLLFSVKLAAGILSSSISIIADAFNNLSDMGSSVVTMIGFKLAGKPADPDHPYGHGRFEYISAFVVAGFILVMGFELLKGAIEKIISPSEIDFGTLSILILSASVLVKLWMFFFNRKLGKAINSSALIATAKDSRNDAFTTLAILASVLVMKFSALNIDAYVGLVMSIYVLWSGIKTARETLDPLLGEPVDEDTAKAIEKEIMSFDGFLGIHDLLAHNYGPGRCFASVHVEVPADTDIVRCHEQIDLCEKLVFERTGVMLTIHMDPVETDNEKLNQAKTVIAERIKTIHPGLTLHDFRMTPKSEERTNLIFDVVLPVGLEKDKQSIKQQIEEIAKSIDSTYRCVITFDFDYIGK